MATKYLDQIDSPRDLKRLSRSELVELAAECRQRIIETTAATGGHLAPSLGAVELTIALHRCLDSPRDRLIWDVGHQCYTHKLITGRREQFHTVRQPGGLSGFPRRDESPHDAFGTGHGSTSISAALGFAEARDLRGGDEKIVAVIGDGALTGGLALEALNQAGARRTNLVVVLNDNEMSISRNVGGMSAYLARIRAGIVEPAIRQARRDVSRMLERLPLGDAMLEAMDRFRDGLKQLVVPGMLFEEFGFTYLGPIDGHDMSQLLAVFEQAFKLSGPVLVHVHTKKGRGYPPAEEDPSRFHGTRPFNIENGKCAPREGPATYSDVFGETLSELAEQDDRIVAISAAMIDGTGLQCFRQRFPDRCLDVGMAEEHAVTFAAGLAAAGMRPVVAIYSSFLQRSYDQILHDVALQKLPVVFCMDRAGIVGDDGPTHHGAFDIAYMRHAPGMVEMVPADESELRDMLLTALQLDGPASIRYPRGCGEGCGYDRPPTALELGKAKVLREGKDVAILALGPQVSAAMEAARALAARGIEATVVNMRFVKPLDQELVYRLAAEVGKLVTVEEGCLIGGFGAAVCECLADAGVHTAAVRRLGLPDGFVPHGQTDDLRGQCGIDAKGIERACLEVCGAGARPDAAPDDPQAPIGL
ncbi:MAG: 1-deoxy-D-xylulose-5-phosphate synthase [Armatimonadetes bacterium]|nr:1-deoxy-D-xylulose-5-phosphate synthase [Armatimonadota bacterium]